jgi:hypothetical protein
MRTVGQLINHLAALDPNTPIGVIDIDRHSNSQRATISLRNLTDVDVVHDGELGTPHAVWLSAEPGRPDELPDARPIVVLTRTPCGCLIPIALEERQTINLDAYACPHHQPHELVVRSSHG